VKSKASAVIRCEVYGDLLKLLGYNVSLTTLMHTTGLCRTIQDTSFRQLNTTASAERVTEKCHNEKKPPL